MCNFVRFVLTLTLTLPQNVLWSDLIWSNLLDLDRSIDRSQVQRNIERERAEAGGVLSKSDLADDGSGQLVAVEGGDGASTPLSETEAAVKLQVRNSSEPPAPSTLP